MVEDKDKNTTSIFIFWDEEEVTINGQSGPTSDSESKSITLKQGSQVNIGFDQNSLVFSTPNEQPLFVPIPSSIQHTSDMLTPSIKSSLNLQSYISSTNLPEKIKEEIISKFDVFDNL